MDVAQDTLPELQRIFQYLNSHSNKLYQEGYFLKLHDLDGREYKFGPNREGDLTAPGGRPSPDRNWTEVFAQLVGTVLSVWDAQKLDEAGTDGEVVPSFINLADASIKMVCCPTPITTNSNEPDRIAANERPGRPKLDQRLERIHGRKQPLFVSFQFAQLPDSVDRGHQARHV